MPGVVSSLQRQTGRGSDPASDAAAVPYRIGQPLAVDWSNPNNVKQVLAARRLVTIGFEVYPSFETTGADGVVAMPGDNEDLIGGHGVLVVGYDDPTACWIVRNQWGAGWADAGYCYQPYGYEGVTWLEAWTY